MNSRFYSKKIILRTTLIILAVLIKVFSFYPAIVEKGYSTGFYITFSNIIRFLFGWIPFSIGDILYLLTALWLLYLLFRTVRAIIKKTITWKNFYSRLSSTFFTLVFIYVIFNSFWGINYNRLGIAYQMKFDSLYYDSLDVFTLQQNLINKVNKSKELLTINNAQYPDNKTVFRHAVSCYHQAEGHLSFLAYRNRSVKSSMYGTWGNYLGFTGYYNPFSGEAQVNTTVPDFLIPGITLHEMGHQLGYAKEDEASFAGYLAAVYSNDSLFLYSTYLDLFMFANREAYYYDSARAITARRSLSPEVKKDIEEWRQFNLTHQGYLEPAITWLYSRYLKVNQQPEGMRSYNLVIAMVIAHYKKYGFI